MSSKISMTCLSWDGAIPEGVEVVLLFEDIVGIHQSGPFNTVNNIPLHINFVS